MYDSEKTRLLNDQFRKSFCGGKVVATRGIMALQDMPTVLNRVREFNDFTEDNDPHHEHDFGAFMHNGQQVFWKLNYYSVDLNQGSPDPADSTVTTRVLTVMLAEDY